jgi:hypothetical protein
MDETLLVQKIENTENDALATVIMHWPLPRENEVKKDDTLNKKRDKELPLFYTSPIFKPRRHEFVG